VSKVRLLGALACTAAAFAAAQSFRESVRVEIVRIDLLALDSSGRPRPDLLRADVQVRVDGKAVPIEGFEAPVFAASKEPGPPPPEPPTVPSPAASPAPAAAAPTPYSMAFLVDETSTDAPNRPAVYREIATFLESPLPEETRVLLARFNGELRVECPWTSDRERLRGVLAAMSRRPSVARLGTPGRTSGDAVAGAGGVQFEVFEAVARARKSMDAVFDALRIFPDLPGRKALYVVSDGAPFLTSYEIAQDVIRGSESNVDPLDPDAARKAGLEADRDTNLLLDSLAWDRTKTKSLTTDVARLALLRGVEIHPLRAAAHDLDGRIRSDRAFHERADVGMGRSLTRRSQRGGEAPPMTDIAAGQGMEEIARSTSEARATS
jgi:VWFA-related protein